jgi:hypothetical protein
MNTLSCRPTLESYVWVRAMALSGGITNLGSSLGTNDLRATEWGASGATGKRTKHNTLSVGRHRHRAAAAQHRPRPTLVLEWASGSHLYSSAQADRSAQCRHHATVRKQTAFKAINKQHYKKMKPQMPTAMSCRPREWLKNALLTVGCTPSPTIPEAMRIFSGCVTSDAGHCNPTQSLSNSA